MASSLTDRPAGVILAGGAGRRMGGADKALLRLRGRTLLSLVADRLAPQVAALALNANGDAARFCDTGLPVLRDELHDAGPLAGILAGMDWAAARGYARIVTAAVDTPEFPGDLVARLVHDAGPGAAYAASDRAHPTFGLWPVALRDDLRARLLAGERKLGLWAQQIGAARVIWPKGDRDPFTNINTPEDLAQAEGHV
jgi:molybdopterin-guanine dinucleotide biosynthesis protein A